MHQQQHVPTAGALAVHTSAFSSLPARPPTYPCGAGKATGLRQLLGQLPSAVFQKSLPGRKFTVGQRAGTFVKLGLEYSLGKTAAGGGWWVGGCKSNCCATGRMRLHRARMLCCAGRHCVLSLSSSGADPKPC